MTAEEYITARVRALTGMEPDADLVKSCVDDAQNFIKEYCGIDSVPPQLSGMVKTLALRSYNELGVEGFSSFSQGGRRIVLKDLSASDKSRLNRFRIAAMVGGE